MSCEGGQRRVRGGDGELLLDAASGVATKYHYAAASFETEVAALRALEHPSIVRLLGCCIDKCACQLPLFDTDLMQLLLSGRPTDADYVDATQLATALLGGLAACHAQSLVHCDVKPENVLVGFEPLRYVLCDFGRAVRLVGEDGRPLAELPRSHIGTRTYMAPEAGLGRCMTANDCWAAGIVLYASIERELPFDDDDEKERDLEDALGRVRRYSQLLLDAGDPPLQRTVPWPPWARPAFEGLLRVTAEIRWSAAQALHRVTSEAG